MLETLNKRLQYRGGNQEGRFQKDKLAGLRKALLYSYQAATAILADGREFRCLINPDKLKADYDNKIISIPYKDVCLNEQSESQLTTSEGMVDINLKSGDIFEWKETGTKWLVYLQYLEEDAYFRAEIRRCKYEIDLGNGKKTWAYVRGPVETTIQWNQKKGIVWNDLNYSVVLNVPKNADTLAFFHRFTKIKVNGENYEVVAIDSFAADNIIEVHLKEYFSNNIEEQGQEWTELNKVQIESMIQGETLVEPYGTYTYTINILGGEWSTKDKSLEIVSIDNEGGSALVNIYVPSGRGKNTELYYTRGNAKYTLPITIDSLF